MNFRESRRRQAINEVGRLLSTGQKQQAMNHAMNNVVSSKEIAHWLIDNNKIKSNVSIAQVEFQIDKEKSRI